MVGKRHLCIGDPHVKPGQSLERFEWLGNAINDLKPDVVVCTGDFADMNSLSQYDKGQKKFQGENIQADFDAVNEAQQILKYSVQEKLWGAIKWAILVGNHEERIERMVEANPEWDGKIGYNDLSYHIYWDTIVPFKQSRVIDGIAYSHFFPSGILGKSISEPNLALKLLRVNHMSSTVGHSHSLSYENGVKANGKRIHGLSAGYYGHPKWKPGYAKGATKFWWNGLVLKENVKDGDYSPKFFCMDEVKANWGK